MNKRIQELAEQAKAFIVESERAKIAEVSEVSFSKYEDLEKFAELIVRECATIADQAEPYKANDLILKHFGVEDA